MPDLAAPAVAAPAAPSAPAPAAPVATPPDAPTAPAVQPEAAPAAESAAPEAPAGQPEAPAAPPAGGKAEPKREDYGDDIERFLKDHYAWEEEQPAEGEPPAEAAPEEAAPPAEEKPAEAAPEEGHDLEEELAANPETIRGFETADPAFKAALDANPKLRGQIYKMAREYAKAQPIAELFPTVESAQFASDTANRVVGMREAFMLAAEDPARIGQAFDLFLDEFKVVDEKGQPILDEHGQPKIAEDFETLGNYMLDMRDSGELAEIEDRIKAGRFASDAERERVEAARDAIKFLKEFRAAAPGDLNRPDVSGMSEEAQNYLADREADIKRREEEAGIRKSEQSKAARTQARQQHEGKFLGSVGSEVGKRLGDYLKEKIDAGVYIPSYVLETMDPQTKISIFAKNVFDKFNQKLASVAEIKQRYAQLQMLPPTEENLNQRLTYHRKLMDEHLGPIIDAELRLVQGKERADRQTRASRAQAARKTVEPEPRGGATPRAQVMTEAEAYNKAMTELRAKYPDADPADLISKALLEKDRLLNRS